MIDLPPLEGMIGQKSNRELVADIYYVTGQLVMKSSTMDLAEGHQVADWLAMASGILHATIETFMEHEGGHTDYECLMDTPEFLSAMLRRAEQQGT